jgi:sugar-specific transcriptional regulator TrmB
VKEDVPASRIPDDYRQTRDALAGFGFDADEANVYLFLLLRGGSKAGSIANELGIHRLDVYDALKRLQGKQVVESTISKPMIFTAVPLDDVVIRIEREMREKEGVQKASLSLLRSESKKLSALRLDDAAIAGDDRLQILSGRRSISERWLKLLNDAQNEILIAIGDEGTGKVLFDRAVDTLSKKIRAGVKVRVLTPITGPASEELGGIIDKLRHLPTSNSAGLCVVDRSKAMIIVESGDRLSLGSKEKTAILLQSRSIVELLWVLFFVGWDTSPGFDAADPGVPGKKD